MNHVTIVILFIFPHPRKEIFGKRITVFVYVPRSYSRNISLSCIRS
jgi:hypothetical protein